MLGARAFTRIGLMGALGGAVNAVLCYLHMPTAIISPGIVGLNADQTASFPFPWHVIPAGALHGALLVLGSVGCARLCWNLRFKIKVTGLVITTWVVGWLSFIPLRVSVFHESWREAVTWPLASGLAGWLDALRAPVTSFGLVAGVYYLLLAVCRQLTARSRSWQMVMGAASGVLGSLYWWASFHRWYFSVLHGVIWGALVGYGVWAAQHGTQDAGLPGPPKSSQVGAGRTQGTA